MKYFVEFVVSALVQRAGEVEVEMTERPDGIDCLVRLNSLDIGRVIGKKGRTIFAIRNLCNAVAAKGGKQVQIELVETN
ncbi:MAG: KH domain-containing protein [Verrucomicrobiales bacterium]|jgi:predicted RNA-binding protein YlqC (UPF0109 family)|nr:KH domain-containing protein [Verrucomicrobiales bacterium]